ncbi:MAG: hypothetical protein M3410_01370 [Acidobacteriota bacterium]|nr:hypothetical protein [Acidobacteriota bacterium]
MGVFIGIRLWGLTASCLWFDEVFSVHAARKEWTRLPGFVAADIIHPPLFYVLLKVWISIGGESLFWLRLFPVLTSIAVIIPFYMFCRELRLRSAEIKTVTQLANFLSLNCGFTDEWLGISSGGALRFAPFPTCELPEVPNCVSTEYGRSCAATRSNLT